jgi:hypothetical protein
MADATTITAVVMAAGAAVTAITPIAMRRRQKTREQDATVLASFTALNKALGQQIERLQGDMDRLRGDYERRLGTAQDRITELESEVATLNRLLLGRRDPPP